MSAAVIESRDLVKRYHDEAVVDGVSLAVDSGEVKVIIGPSGSGKSTLLRCLGLLEQAEEGGVYLEGERIGVREKRGRTVPLQERRLAATRKDLGMVFQNFNLFPHLTAVGNVMSGLTTVRGIHRREARTIAEEALAKVGVAERGHAFPAELSGGQQQRVAIARALVMEPKVLLFDEPTSALDAELVREVLEVIESLAATGMTMVIVTHELSFAQRVADLVCVMDAGCVIEEGEPATLLSAPRQERTRRFLEAVHE
jgi:polar amino acid transport system ATP-binding protein